MGKPKNYNAVIDWWKFVFCIIILIMHVGGYYNNGTYILKHGNFAVEFFFIVSGYFMCAHVMRQNSSDGLKNIGTENIRFIYGKIKPLLPPYLYTWILAFAMYIYKTGFNILKNDGLIEFMLKIIHSIPNLLLLDMGGIKGTTILGVSWYISAMLIVMFITYPMLRKWGQNYCLIASPMIALFLSGFYASQFGTYHSRYFWTGIMNHGLMRGFISINLGCFAYVISRFLNDRLSRTGGSKRVLILILEPVVYICAIALMHFGNGMSLNIINILFLIGVSITMSGQSLFSKICDKDICYFLGKSSLWIYLCQSPVRVFVIKRFPHCSYKLAFTLILNMTILVAAAGMGINILISRQKNKKLPH